MAAGATGGAAGGASAPAAPSSQAAAAPPAPAAQPEPAVPSNGVPAPAAAPPMTGPIAPAQPAPVPATPPAAAKSAAAAAPAKPAAAAAPVAAGAWRIQLAAMRSEDEAKHEWARLQKKHPDLLGKLSLAVQKVTLAGKGEFFRVQGGPLSDRQAAAALCERLKAAQVSCLAVKP
jgi:cell division septation protein DedD